MSETGIHGLTRQLADALARLAEEPDSIDEVVASLDGHALAGLRALAERVALSDARHERDKEIERVKSDFIARISHELRTPLTIIGGFTDTLLLHGDRLDAERRGEVLQRVKTSVGRLSALIEEILSVASFEAGMTRLKLQEVPLRMLLDQARHLSIDQSRVRVDGPDELRVVTDPVLLRHVVNQLVDNALKYAGAAELECRQVNGSIELVVADHGPGIPPDEQARVFQRFYRGNHTGSGMGLGLPVARELAQQLGVALALDETPGGGARFTIRFP